MGVSGQDKASWQTGHLSFDSVVSLLEEMAITATTEEVPQQTARRRLKIAIDASPIGFKYVHDNSSLEPDGAIMLIAMALSSRHIDTSCFMAKNAIAPNELRVNARRKPRKIQSSYLLPGLHYILF